MEFTAERTERYDEVMDWLIRYAGAMLELRRVQKDSGIATDTTGVFCLGTDGLNEIHLSVRCLAYIVDTLQVDVTYNEEWSVGTEFDSIEVYFNLELFGKEWKIFALLEPEEFEEFQNRNNCSEPIKQAEEQAESVEE